MVSLSLLLLAPACALVPQRPARGRHASQLSMGWGDPPVWSDAVVKSNDEAGDGLRAIALEVSPETLEAHRIGGQYVQLTLGEEKPGFYAIASPPVVGPTEGKAFEFLIKENEGNAYLTSLAAGAAVKCSEVSGGGYAVGKAFNGEDGAVDSEYDGFACMNPRANQIFNATSMGACVTVSTRSRQSCFENSRRAIASSRNQPNRLRFDRARDF